MNIEKGRVFWDMPSQVEYVPGSDLACAFYVANPTSSVMRYSLCAELYYKALVLTKETIPVSDLDSFAIEPGDFIIIRGVLKFNETNAELYVALVDANTGEIYDTVSTNLAYTNAIAAYTPSPVRLTADVLAIATTVIIPLALIGMVGTTVAKAAREI